jgi:hypothetical protein
MKKIVCASLCLLLFVSVCAYAQNATKTKSGQAKKAAKAVADPFGGNPAVDEAADPFSGPPPKKRTHDVNPFGRADDGDPFSAAPRQPAVKPKLRQPVAPPVRTMSSDAFPVLWLDSSAARQRIDKILEEEASVKFVDRPLLEALQDISDRHNLPIVIDEKSLDHFGIGTDTPVTISLKEVSLRSTLRLTLKPLELTYIIGDEVVLITTPEEAEAQLATGFYVVSEILPETGDSEWLLRLIRQLVAPDTWDEVGGPGAMVYIEHRETLVISQTADVHTHVRQLLATLSKLPSKGE